MRKHPINRFRGTATLEQLLLVTILGGLAVTCLAGIAMDMTTTAGSYATPILQSVNFDRFFSIFHND